MKGLSNGAFIISTATLLKNGNTQINITFKPLVPGDYEEVIEFSGIKATTETIRITGKATENGTTRTAKATVCLSTIASHWLHTRKTSTV